MTLAACKVASWAVARFRGVRRGELRGLEWTNVDFDNGLVRVERSWDPVKGPVDVKTPAPAAAPCRWRSSSAVS